MKFFPVILFFLTLNITALPSYRDLIPQDFPIEELTLGITRFHNQEFTVEIMPDSIYSEILLQGIEDLQPNMALEGLFFLPSTEPQKEDILRALNIMTSVSKLQGLQYYSASRGEMRLLFEESEVLSDFENRFPLPDPIHHSLPMRVEMNIHQKDLTFGDSDSSVVSYSSNEAIYMEQKNQTPLRYSGLIRVIRPQGFQTRVLMIPCKEGILYYGIMAADTLNIRAFKERENNSFYNRMVAVYHWFVEAYTDPKS
jgi:hypothetical protein